MLCCRGLCCSAEEKSWFVAGVFWCVGFFVDLFDCLLACVIVGWFCSSGCVFVCCGAMFCVTMDCAIRLCVLRCPLLLCFNVSFCLPA